MDVAYSQIFHYIYVYIKENTHEEKRKYTRENDKANVANVTFGESGRRVYGNYLYCFCNF